jgi:hypothetical protein
MTYGEDAEGSSLGLFLRPEPRSYWEGPLNMSAGFNLVLIFHVLR